MSQPKWKCIANLGDVDPIAYGGLLVYVDETGVYPPEIEVICEYENENYDSDWDDRYDAPEDIPEHAYDEDKSEEIHWTIYRVVLDRCTYDPETGVLSDNKFHPQHSVWWHQSFAEAIARPQDSDSRSVCGFVGIEIDELIRLFCSEDPIELAQAYQAVANYHGWYQFDQYPLSIKSQTEMEARYRDDIKETKRK